MRKSMKRLVALFMVLSMCATMAPVVIAAPQNKFVLTTSAVQRSEGGDYQVTYKAELVMPEELATAAAVNKNDAELANIHFICTLTGNLVKLLPVGEEMKPADEDKEKNNTDTWFSFDKTSIYDLVEIKHTAGSDALYIIYKLRDSKLTEWNGQNQPTVAEVKEQLLDRVTMTATRSVTPEQLEAAKENNEIETTAKIDIVAKGGQPKLFEPDEGEFDAVLDGVTAICDAFSNELLCTDNMTITPYSPPPGPGPGGEGGGNQGGSGSVTPPAKPNEFEIIVEKTDSNKGSVNIGSTTGSSGSTGSAGTGSTGTGSAGAGGTGTGSTGTGNSGKATAGDNVSVKIDDIKKGYRAVDVIITAEDGTQIHVDRNEVNEFEFEMPKGDVTVQVVYEVSATHPDDSGVSEKLNSDQHIAFMVGDDKGTFRPNANITRAEVAQIFYALLRDKNVPTTKTFDDVDPDAWYADAVNAMASLGAVKGIGDGNFAPNRKITRAEFATIAAYFAMSARDKYGFKDVNENHWAHDFISTASRYGWVAGVGGNIFEPDRNITRAEAATIVNNMLGRMGDYDMIDAGHGRQFPDVDNSHWGWYEIIEATDSHGHAHDSEFVEEIWHD